MNRVFIVRAFIAYVLLSYLTVASLAAAHALPVVDAAAYSIEKPNTIRNAPQFVTQPTMVNCHNIASETSDSMSSACKLFCAACVHTLSSYVDALPSSLISSSAPEFSALYFIPISSDIEPHPPKANTL